ncbi:MAG: prepilin-type N-terminal cleavage/methylation domain-containing protein [Eubacteriaceae bacterium]|nr:prepilin-type N-terminal cleavage/methylation domain-containing protein [Eubacteriaceae bacterium]
MMQMIEKKSALRKRGKKGFTLVEVIVVLVILAILAAILVPSMIGWINKAQKKTAVVEARSVLLATQEVATENYKVSDADLQTGMKEKAPGTSAYAKDVYTLAELDAPAEITAITISNHKVTAFTYISTDNKTVTYTKADGYSVK